MARSRSKKKSGKPAKKSRKSKKADVSVEEVEDVEAIRGRVREGQDQEGLIRERCPRLGKYLALLVTRRKAVVLLCLQRH